MYVSDQRIGEAIKLFREYGPVLRTSEALEAGQYYLNDYDSRGRHTIYSVTQIDERREI